MIKKQLSVCTLALGVSLASISSHADVLGLYVGGGIWQGSLGGDIGVDQNPATIDELGMEDKQSTFLFAEFEHPVPVLPNLRIAMNNISLTGDSTISRDIEIGGDITFPAEAETQTELDLSHIDYTLYWEILDNYVSWDIGLTARAFDGSAQIEYTCPDSSACTGETDSEQEDLGFIIPMLYSKVQIDLPFSGWHVGANVNYIGLDENSISDVDAKIGYMTSGLGVDVGFDLGYRQLNLSVEDDEDLTASVTLSGPYASLIVHF